jgi:osmotically-inducible protein OsmY
MKMRLPGLVGAVLTIVAAGCTSLTDDGSGRTAATDDDYLESLVLDRLEDDMTTRRQMYGVEAADGIVTLRGRVPDEQIRARALSIVRATPGVTDVRDLLTTW